VLLVGGVLAQFMDKTLVLQAILRFQIFVIDGLFGKNILFFACESV